MCGEAVLEIHESDQIKGEIAQSPDAGTSPAAPDPGQSLSQIIAASPESSELTESQQESDPLSHPVLPPLLKRDRARLLVQSPFRVYFYWTLRKDPYTTLKRILGGKVGNYRLFIRLVDSDTGKTEMYPAEGSGNWWFDVDPEHKYRAEIGFFAPFRPFIRIAYSNTVETPPQRPSPRQAETAQWRVPSRDFAQILSAVGYRRDAYNVRIAGDLENDSDALESLSYILGYPKINQRFTAEEIRFALHHLAQGLPIETLRWKIGATLFSFLQQYLARLQTPEAVSRIKERFPALDEYTEEESPSDYAIGSGMIHFPRFRRPAGPGRRSIPFEENVSSPATSGRGNL